MNLKPLLFIFFICPQAFSEVQNPEWDKLNSFVGIVTYAKDKSDNGVCSGIALNENIVLTSAHCLVNSEKVKILTGNRITFLDYLGLGKGYPSKTWTVHPHYRGAIFNSVDLGVIYLEKSLPARLNYLDFSRAKSIILKEGEALERLGIGQRKSQNRMTWVNSYFTKYVDEIFQSQDQYGFPGDSGGPVLLKEANTYVLVGIHAGKVVDDKGNPIDYSYAVPIRENYPWILKTIEELTTD